jgi:hypothetical protein
MYVLSRAINKKEYIFYLMDETHRPIKAKIQKAWMGEAIELTRKFAAENNVSDWEMNTEKGRDKQDNYQWE